MENTRYKILMVEDDKLDQMAFKRLVENEKLPYDYTIAGSVAEAKSILGTERFDIVVSDYSLGDGTAFDILNSVKNTPIILVTGAGNEEVAVKAWRAGAYDYLTKDADRNYLKALPITIENAIKQKKAEEEIHRLSQAIEQSPSTVVIANIKGDIEYVNPGFTRLTGYTLEEVKGKNLRILESSEQPPELHKELWKTITSGKEWRGEFHNRKKNKGLYWESASISAITNSEGAIIGFLKVAEDITERKEAEEKLKEAIELKSQFISTVSHELRTPLTSMKEGIAVVLDGVAGEINDDQRNFLNIAQRNVDRLASLINNVLDFQKLEAGKMKVNLQENDINEVVEEVQKTMLPSAKKKGIDILLELDNNLPKARFDRDKIIQVLTNLVSNAIKFTEQGQVSIGVQQRDEELVIRVKDTGMGIPKDELPKIFDRFYRVQRPGTQIQGTGLGLAIVEKIVAMHGGRIEVESEVDQGTTFTVFLPLFAKPVPEFPSAEMDKLLENNLVNNQTHTK
jgi:PAS domain S-box-containing protein